MWAWKTLHPRKRPSFAKKKKKNANDGWNGWDRCGRCTVGRGADWPQAATVTVGQPISARWIRMWRRRYSNMPPPFMKWKTFPGAPHQGLSNDTKWGLCALRHGIQISMEAILACHPARSTEWLDCHPKSCELWRIRTGPIWEASPMLIKMTNVLKRGQLIMLLCTIAKRKSVQWWKKMSYWLCFVIRKFSQVRYVLITSSNLMPISFSISNSFWH